MSHRIGTLQVLSPTVMIGPGSGSPATSPDTWTFSFSPAPAPTGTKFVMLHFTAASFPASNRLEVDLGYDTDVFTAADLPDFWTRPVKLAAAGTVTTRYVTNGSASGHAVLGEYGRGEPMESVITADPNFHNHTNPDLFLLASPYVEPSYELRGFCSTTPNWENIARYQPGMCAPRWRKASASLCMPRLTRKTASQISPAAPARSLPRTWSCAPATA